MFDPDAGNLIFVLSAALDTALLCAGAVWAARGNPPWRRLVVALAASGVLLAIKGWFLLRLGVELGFGVMHVLWLDLVVALPAAALLFLILAGRRAHCHCASRRWQPACSPRSGPTRH